MGMYALGTSTPGCLLIRPSPLGIHDLPQKIRPDAELAGLLNSAPKMGLDSAGLIRRRSLAPRIHLGAACIAASTGAQVQEFVASQRLMHSCESV